MKKLLTLVVIAGIFVSCNNMNKNDEGSNNMTASNDMAAKNEERTQAFYDQILNAHNPAMADSFCTSDVVDHSPAPGHTGNGLEDVRNEFKDLFTLYPDLHITAKNIVSKGDMVYAYVEMKGTNSGSLPNMPATNKSFDIEGVDMMKVKDGKATERWGFFQDMKMMQQLGMMPDMSKMKDQAMDQKK